MGRRENRGEPITGAYRDNGDESRRKSDRPGREAEGVKDCDHTIGGHPCEFESNRDTNRHRQGNVENRWQSAKKRWHEQPATDSGRWKIMKKRGHDDRNAKTRFD